MHTIAVRHNIETAHRLSLHPGRCENIHGHSMWVELELSGALSSAGMVEDLDFGAVKKAFRAHLDDQYDHHLLLSQQDSLVTDFPAGTLPGLVVCEADPTTENIALWVGQWARTEFGLSGSVRVNETHVNAATWRWST